MWFVFRKSFHNLQLISMVGILVGTGFLFWPSENQFQEKAKKDSKWGWILLCIQLVFQACASIYTEWVLKFEFNTPLCLQNVGMYAWGMIAQTTIFLIKYLNEGEAKNVFTGFTWMVWLEVAVFCLLGITVSKILKSHSTIVKMLCSTTAILLTNFVCGVFLDERYELFHFIGMSLILLMSMLYGYGTQLQKMDKTPEDMDHLDALEIGKTRSSKCTVKEVP